MTASRSYQRGCLAKNKYDSKVDALIQATKNVRKGAPPLRVYQ